MSAALFILVEDTTRCRALTQNILTFSVCILSVLTVTPCWILVRELPPSLCDLPERSLPAYRFPSRFTMLIATAVQGTICELGFCVRFVKYGDK